MAQLREYVDGSLVEGNPNWQKPFAPFTRFGTRQLAFFQVSIYGLSDNTLTGEENGDNNVNPYFVPEGENAYDAGGYFQKAIQGVQQNVELYGVFRPGDGRGDSDGNSFLIMVAADTANTGNEDPMNTNDMAQSIADAVYNTVGEYTEVYHMRIRGGETRYTDLSGLEVAEKAQASKASAGQQPG